MSSENPSRQQKAVELIADGLNAVTAHSFGVLVGIGTAGLAALLGVDTAMRVLPWGLTGWLGGLLGSAMLIGYRRDRIIEVTQATAPNSVVTLVAQLHDWADEGTDKIQNATVRP